MYKKSGGSGRRPQIFIHPDASKTKWPGEVIFDSDGGHFVFDASGCIKNLGTPRTGRHHPRGCKRVAFGGVVGSTGGGT